MHEHEMEQITRQETTLLAYFTPFWKKREKLSATFAQIRGKFLNPYFPSKHNNNAIIT